jgi:orotate phosphoribosyltransferase
VRCARCPLPAGAACVGTLCDRAGDAAWDRHILGRSALAPASAPAAAPPAPNRHFALLGRARACPHRQDVGLGGACGCVEPRVCLAGRGRHVAQTGRDAGDVVILADCLDCTRARPRGLLPDLEAATFVTTARLLEDTRTLLAALPPDIDAVVAVARSGLLPGTLIAFRRHLPLRAVSRYTGVTDPGHGWRLEGRGAAPPRHVLLVDDTVANGFEMGLNLPAVRAAFPGARVTKAVVYAHPRGADAVDLFVALYPGMHYLEWNWCNAGHGAATGFDFDGILCRDFTPEECATDESYRRAMATIPPLHLPRRAPVPLIVTARPESTRAISEAWLARHGVRFERLVMKDFETDPARDWNAQIAEYKAWHYGRSGCAYFAESDPAQARVIHDRTGLPVLCPQLGRVLGAPAA